MIIPTENHQELKIPIDRYAARYIPEFNALMARDRDCSIYQIPPRFDISTLTLNIIVSCLERWAEHHNNADHEFIAKDLCKADKSRKELFRVALAARHLNIKLLQQVACDVIVEFIKSSYAHHIVKTFKICEATLVITDIDQCTSPSEQHDNEWSGSSDDLVVIDQDEIDQISKEVSNSNMPSRDTEVYCDMPYCSEPLRMLKNHTCRLCGAKICQRCTRLKQISNDQYDAFQENQQVPTYKELLSRGATVLRTLDINSYIKDPVCVMCFRDTASDEKKYRIARDIFEMCMFRPDITEACDFNNLSRSRVLGLADIVVLLEVSPAWSLAAKSLLDQYLKIQHYLPTQILTNQEKRFLRFNRHYLVGHRRWTLQLIRAADWRSERFPEDFQDVSQSLPCYDVGCSVKGCQQGKCKSQLQELPAGCSELLAEDGIELLCSERPGLWSDYAVIRSKPTLIHATAQNNMQRSTSLQQLRNACVALIFSVWPKFCNSCGIRSTTSLVHQANEDYLRITTLTDSDIPDLFAALQSALNDALRSSDCDCQEARFAAEQFMLDFLPGLVRALTDERIDAGSSMLFENLIREAQKSKRVSTSLYWALQQQSRDPEFSKSLIREQLVQAETQQKDLLLGHQFIDSIRRLKNGVSSISEAKNTLMRGLVKFGLVDSDQMSDIGILKTADFFRIPLFPDFRVQGIDLDSVRILDSSQKPVVFDIMGEFDGGMDTRTRLKIAFKAEDMRKDWVVMNVIRRMAATINATESQTYEKFGTLPFVTYNVLPVDRDSGIMEFIRGAKTVSELIDGGKTIVNWLADVASEQASMPDAARHTERRYLDSLCCSTVMSYLLGLGDRHNENVMLTEDGRFFHIDFGYVVGEDPKKTIKPTLKLDTQWMVGNPDGPHYKRFVDLACTTYKELIGHTNTFFTMLMEIAYAKPSIDGVDSDKYVKELSERFGVGKTPEEATKDFRVLLQETLGNKSKYKERIYEISHSLGKAAKNIGRTMWVS